jgi:CBS domain-containing protein
MMAESGSAVHHLPVEQAMTRNVFTCDVNDSINSVIDRMTKGKFRHIPVLENDRLLRQKQAALMLRAAILLGITAWAVASLGQFNWKVFHAGGQCY